MPEGRILLKRIAQSKKLAKLKTDGARLLYTWTLSHLDINGCFHGDAEILNSLIFTRLKKTDEEVESYLKDIEANGLIVRYDTNGDTYQIYPDFEDKQPKLRRNKEAKPSIPLPTPDQLQTNAGPSTELPGTSKVKQSKVKNILSRFATVYLNKTTGTKFRLKTSATKRLISARYKEGFRARHFKYVIDIKCSQWLNDPKMKKYLRPQTLFGTKFESYLNETEVKRKFL